jgi:hypothetical protein
VYLEKKLRVSRGIISQELNSSLSIVFWPSFGSAVHCDMRPSGVALANRGTIDMN